MSICQQRGSRQVLYVHRHFCLHQTQSHHQIQRLEPVLGAELEGEQAFCKEHEYHTTIALWVGSTPSVTPNGILQIISNEGSLRTIFAIPVALFSIPDELHSCDKMTEASHFESFASHPRSLSGLATWPLSLGAKYILLDLLCNIDHGE